mmetsp:Transcript_24891/g.61138  ORF Transcript_24891/g.61138 Transcript_24891/m.61138 type:complete len:344 (-) Transcript_24891:1391-2422(-)
MAHHHFWRRSTRHTGLIASSSFKPAPRPPSSASATSRWRALQLLYRSPNACGWLLLRARPRCRRCASCRTPCAPWQHGAHTGRGASVHTSFRARARWLSTLSHLPLSAKQGRRWRQECGGACASRRTRGSCARLSRRSARPHAAPRRRSSAHASPRRSGGTRKLSRIRRRRQRPRETSSSITPRSAWRLARLARRVSASRVHLRSIVQSGGRTVRGRAELLSSRRGSRRRSSALTRATRPTRCSILPRSTWPPRGGTPRRERAWRLPRQVTNALSRSSSHARLRISSGPWTGNWRPIGRGRLGCKLRRSVGRPSRRGTYGQPRAPSRGQRRASRAPSLRTRSG